MCDVSVFGIHHMSISVKCTKYLTNSAFSAHSKKYTKIGFHSFLILCLFPRNLTFSTTCQNISIFPSFIFSIFLFHKTRYVLTRVKYLYLPFEYLLQIVYIKFKTQIWCNTDCQKLLYEQLTYNNSSSQNPLQFMDNRFGYICIPAFYIP